MQSLSKLKNMIFFFIEKFNGVFVTKMNKLLFYTDFLSYREEGMGISGLAYKAIQYGPVPENRAKIYSLTEDVSQDLVECANGNNGTKPVSDIPYDRECFTNEQLQILETVYKTFKHNTPAEISQTSHNEAAWIENENAHSYIDYKYAFSLKEV